MTAQRLTAIPRDLVALSDYERFAREHLDDNAWVYLNCGAADEITLRENRSAFDRIRLKGHVLRDVRGGHTRLELFDQSYAHPIFLAPVAYQRLFHPDGELATATGASAMAAGMVVSTLSSTPLEDIAQTAQTPLWFQLYIQPSRERTLSLVKRAEACGYRAIVITLDAPLAGIRNSEQRIGFQLPPHVRAVNLDAAPSLPVKPLAAHQSVVFDGLMADVPTWDDIEWLVASTALPVLVKGILDADDAARALRCGVAGIVVSNHGGRIQDTLPASIDALPGVVQAVDGRVPVLLDGGVRRGSDVFKALALGARGVFIGRPCIHALATAGALGVAHAVRILREELEVVMALNGCATLESIGEDSLFSQR